MYLPKSIQRESFSTKKTARSVENCDIILNDQIETALHRFGNDILTAREQDVVRLVLRGLPSKLIARKLQIAPKTEGVHRSNAYAKLGLNSRSMLFLQFLQFLSLILTNDGDL
ncbi:response regulator transcription factor [Sneathiella sp.]|uniref:response regulator transcription factor n=1 Tax=Sneathiella sp. TaxID=1964365 RepID=UPI00356AE9C5